MDNDSVALILLIVLIVSGFLLILIRLSKFGNDFGRKKQYLLNEMYRGGLQRSLLAQRTPLPLPLPYSVRDRAQRNEGVSRILPPRKARSKGKALGRSYAHPRPLKACYLHLFYLPLRRKPGLVYRKRLNGNN